MEHIRVEKVAISPNQVTIALQAIRRAADAGDVAAVRTYADETLARLKTAHAAQDAVLDEVVLVPEPRAQRETPPQ